MRRQRSTAGAAAQRLAYANSGVSVTVLPEAATLSGPVHHVESFIKSLKLIGRADSPRVISQ